MMKADGVTINDVPKTHFVLTMVDYRRIEFDQSDLQIPLQFIGVFSYFHTRVPSETEMHACEKLFLTPESSD